MTWNRTILAIVEGGGSGTIDARECLDVLSTVLFLIDMATPPFTWRIIASSSFLTLAALYLSLFASYGTESPFFPSFLASRGLSPGQIGILLSAGTIVRLLSGPCVGIVADRFGTRLMLSLAVTGAGTIILLYIPSASFASLLGVCLLHSVMTAPLNPLVDVLALQAIAREGLYPYGWLRGIGSAGFVVGILASGVIVSRVGLDGILIVASMLLLTMLMPISRLPPPSVVRADTAYRAIATLLAIPQFRFVLVVSSLVVGSHAMSDTFAVIHWRHAGFAASTVSLLWSEAVGSEIVVFVIIGPWLLRRVGPAKCAALAGCAGVLRWSMLASSIAVPTLIAAQGLHGLTFSLMHLACMQVIASIVPANASATAQTLYGTLFLGLASALFTAVSGFSYGTFGVHAFWLMSAICLFAIPFTRKLEAGATISA